MARLASIVWSACAGAAIEDDCTPLFVAADLFAVPIEDIAGRSLATGIDYRVGTIEVVRQDVFNTDDPAEDNVAFRLANRWHVVTREGAVRDLLLFREGDSVTVDEIAESERSLRAKAYLYDARIVANSVCPASGEGHSRVSRVDLVVVTRDVWSLSPELSVTRTGGEDRVRAGISEINLVGGGSRLDVALFENLDRRGVGASYEDANLGRSRIGVQFRYDDTDDGELVEAGIGQPFYALSARRSWNAYVLRSNTLQGLYRGGERFASFRRGYRLAQLSRGWSAGRRNGWVSRTVAGVTLEDWRHSPASQSPLTFPSRRFVYPWMSFHRIEDEYAQVRNVDRVQTTEDVYLGRRYDLLFGYSGDGDGYAIASAEYRDGHRHADRGILRYGVRLSGYWNATTRQPENAIARLWASYRYRQTPRWALILDGDATASDGLTADQQVLIGGQFGAAGLPQSLPGRYAGVPADGGGAVLHGPLSAAYPAHCSGGLRGCRSSVEFAASQRHAGQYRPGTPLRVDPYEPAPRLPPRRGVPPRRRARRPGRRGDPDQQAQSMTRGVLQRTDGIE